MIEQKDMRAFSFDFPIDNSNSQAYKLCANDYFKGIGPFGSPFAFLSYGITYKEIVDFAKLSVEFIDFIFNFLFDDISGTVRDQIIQFLKETGLTAAEIKWRIKML